ncbi:manganese efflux pump MntP family protein [Meridianimarinicoccus sp. MJW13]|uniref:manganese efflux pump MntP n=1 Tax=Meridianimarinicoccus sp. MJW13 TaxID=2720031 RepID=UPI0018688D78|nr:manganese efflux pump MntP family protein [Fluviibacterium sp. MJW13]
MSPTAIGVLAVSMSMDAFVASLGQGTSEPRPSFAMTLRTGVIFGLVEALTPLIGWAAGMAAARHIAVIDHWIAFLLLAGVGAHMALQAWRDTEHTPRIRSVWATVVTAMGTSVDAMAVGVSLSFLQVNILWIALAIGATTMVMSSTGVLLGRLICARFGRIAETLGGVALVAIGTTILWQHLSGAA